MNASTKVKSAKGSMAVYVSIVLLSMILVLTAIFLISNSVRKNQINTVIKVKETYEADNHKADEIYEGLTGNKESEYVKEGMVLHYDGINNTGKGHSNTASTWKDLSGKGNDGKLYTEANNSNFYWEEKNITVSGHDGTMKYYIDTPLNLGEQERTYIYTIDAKNLQGTIWGDTDGQNRNGVFNYSNFFANRGNSSEQNIYNYTFSKGGIYSYAISLSNTEIKFYVNGKIEYQMKNTIGLNSKNSLRLLAGRYESQNQNVTNLKMYNFMVYNRVLNETEIKKNFDVDVQKFDITEYVEEGMVLHYDGVNNTGKGHNNTASTWKDLSGKGNDGNFSKTPNTSNFYWKENCIVLSNNKKNVYVDTPLSLNNSERTIIYTVDASNLSGTIWGDTDDNNSNGLFNYSTFLANRGAGTDIQNRYDYNFKREGIYNYAVSLSSSELKFYENGKLKTTIKNTIGLKTNNNMRLLAARYTGSNQSSSNIKMYNFLIYNRVLSDAEIEKTYYIDKEKYGF